MVAAMNAVKLEATTGAEGFRAQVQESARRFKASWLELAAHLARVRREGMWKEWGYSTFETYCSKELRIKRATAQKLVASYGFLEKREPERLADEGFTERAPSFEVIEVLSRAEERGQLDDETYKEVRERLWEQPVDAAALRKELSARFPEPEPPPPPVDLELRRFGNQARKLARDLAGSPRVPRAIAERAAALADEVEALVRGD